MSTSEVFKSSKPTASSVYADPLLTNMSVAYLQDPMSFVNGMTPAITSPVQDGLFPVFSKSDFLRDDVGLLGPEGDAPQTGYSVSQSSFHCDVWAVKTSVTEQLRGNWSLGGNPDDVANMLLQQKMRIKLEKLWVSAYFGASIWSAGDVTVAAGDKWDVATSDPLEQVLDAKVSIRASTGFEPNVMAVSPHVFKALRVHPLIRNHFSIHAEGMVTAQMLASYFGVERFFEVPAVQESAAEGGTSSVGFIGGKHALLAYVAPQPALMLPSAMYRVNWDFLPAGGTEGIAVYRYDKPPHAQITELNVATKFIVPSADLGYFFGSAVS